MGVNKKLSEITGLYIGGNPLSVGFVEAVQKHEKKWCTSQISGEQEHCSSV